MYVFVTYAHAGMRGVLARGLKVAEHFDKEDVFFIHSGDDDWLKASGYKHENMFFDTLCLPSEVKLPRNTKCVIFCDIPTNHPYQTSILLATRERKIPCVVLENIYRRDQTKELVYRNTASTCDALILTGIDLFKSEERDNIHVVPPPINRTAGGKNEEDTLRRKYHIPPGKRIVFLTGYSDTKGMLMKMTKKIGDEVPDAVFVVSITDKMRNRKNIIFVPYLEPEEYSLLISMSEIMICKKGYLQVLEAILMNKPFVVTGEVQGFFDEWIDPELNAVINYYPRFGSELVNRILKLLKDEKEKKRFVNVLKNCHGSKADGSKETAMIIKATKYRGRKAKKILVLSTATEAKLSKIRKLINDGDFVLPFIISIPFKLRNDEGSDIVRGFDYNMLGDNSDVLKPGFSINYHFSYNSLHALAGVFPWYGELIRTIQKLANVSDEIIVVGEATKKLTELLLRDNRKKVRFVEV